jgi:hypothetical protein
LNVLNAPASSLNLELLNAAWAVWNARSAGTIGTDGTVYLR